jgi:hypothetical protein
MKYLSTKVEAAELLPNKEAITIIEFSGLSCLRGTCVPKYFAGKEAREVVSRAIETARNHGCYRD